MKTSSIKSMFGTINLDYRGSRLQQLPQAERRFRFGVFEVDLRVGELRKDGLRIKLQQQPFQVLAMLLERAPDIVTREELEKEIWSGDTFVDFDHSLRNAVNKIREVLADSADSPRFIETIPKRGYRFITPVASIAQPVGAALPSSGGDGSSADKVVWEAVPVSEAAPTASPVKPARRIRAKTLLLGLSGVALIAAASAALWYLAPVAPKPVMRLTMGVAPAEELTGLT